MTKLREITGMNMVEPGHRLYDKHTETDRTFV